MDLVPPNEGEELSPEQLHALRQLTPEQIRALQDLGPSEKLALCEIQVLERVDTRLWERFRARYRWCLVISFFALVLTGFLGTCEMRSRMESVVQQSLESAIEQQVLMMNEKLEAMNTRLASADESIQQYLAEATRIETLLNEAKPYLERLTKHQESAWDPDCLNSCAEEHGDLGVEYARCLLNKCNSASNKE